MNTPLPPTFVAMLFAALAATAPLAAQSAAPATPPPKQMEKLGRGVAALNQGDGNVFVSWRLLGTDPEGVTFNVYRQTGAGAPVKLNAAPLLAATHYQDKGVDLAQDNIYTVRPVVNGVEGDPSKPFLNKLAANSPARNYFSVPIQTPQGFQPNDASVGDLDGDGEYEIVLHQVSGGQDNAFAGFTGEPVLEAYKMDGTLLWRINLGKNVRDGAHYTQFMVYDLDGDGHAEVVCKTADGTRDGQNNVIGDATADWVERGGTYQPTRDSTGSTTLDDGTRVAMTDGRLMRGPEYLTVFEGRTGKALATTDYIPFRDPDNKNHSPTPERMNEIWGDYYANRSDRFLAAVAYLDGERPSVVMCRGYYTRTVLAAWDWRDGKLTQRWVFDTGSDRNGPLAPFRGQGAHSLTVGDVDADGKDEIVYGACVIDDNGTGLYSTRLGHGDALHLTDMDPDRPGLEVWMIHENPQHQYGAELHDAKTGEIIWGKPGVEGQRAPDTGRGVAMDVDPRYPGYEMWSSLPNLYSARGEVISQAKPNSVNFAIWWDGDLLREPLNGNTISKWNWEEGRTETLLTAQGASSNNGSKSTPTLSADLFGDWREELMLRANDGRELRIYMTNQPTEFRLPTLMHDPQYRAAIAWQNVAYNQPPHPGFYLGAGMKSAPKPNIVTPAAKP